MPREPLLRNYVRHLDPSAEVYIPPYGNGFLAIILAAVNIFGGFLVTQRMLAMYKKKKKER